MAVFYRHGLYSLTLQTFLTLSPTDPDSRILGLAMPQSDVREDDGDDVLLPTLIDNRAYSDPDKLYCAYIEPNHTSVEEGLRTVTYGQFANAVNRCAWWLKKEIGNGQNFETLAYVGPSDIRYAIVTLAAVKTNHKVILFH